MSNNILKEIHQTTKGNYSKRLSDSLQKGTHQSFRTDSDFYRHLIESIDGYAVFTTDRKGSISSWNSGAKKLLGYSEKEIIGKNINILFTSQDIKNNLPKKERTAATR